MKSVKAKHGSDPTCKNCGNSLPVTSGKGRKYCNTCKPKVRAEQQARRRNDPRSPTKKSWRDNLQTDTKDRDWFYSTASKMNNTIGSDGNTEYCSLGTLDKKSKAEREELEEEYREKQDDPDWDHVMSNGLKYDPHYPPSRDKLSVIADLGKKSGDVTFSQKDGIIIRDVLQSKRLSSKYKAELGRIKTAIGELEKTNEKWNSPNFKNCAALRNSLHSVPTRYWNTSKETAGAKQDMFRRLADHVDAQAKRLDSLLSKQKKLWRREPRRFEKAKMWADHIATGHLNDEEFGGAESFFAGLGKAK